MERAMRLAALGVDAECLQLVQAARADGHHIVWLGDADANVAKALDWPEPPRPAANWEDVLDPSVAGAVVLGRGAAGAGEAIERLQELVRLERPTLATFPLTGEVLPYFLVDMAQREHDALLWHYNPLLESDWLRWAADCVASGHPDLGPVQQVAAVREAGERRREDVERHFARDAEALDRVVGGLDQVGAHGAEHDAGYAALAVQLMGRRHCPVRWHVAPPAGDPGLELSLVGEQGREVARFDVDGRLTARWLETQAGRRPLDAGSDAVPARSAWGRFAAAVAASDELPADAGRSTWSSALHAMELADTIELSLRKHRMIDVHQQQLTEQLAFRGTMAAVGCGVLLVLPPLLLFAGWGAGLLGFSLASYWPHALLGLLTAFLVVQLLPKLV